jgi:dethiobiotin synthetase
MSTTRGLFVTGTDTGVGKTYLACLIARALREQALRVGVYKPAASGCRTEQGRLISDDAVALWEAAGRPGDVEHVCPQCFAAPTAPHLAARAEGRRVDRDLLRRGLDYWRERSDVLVVEGVGGLLTPISDEDYVANLAREFGFPLVVVSRNALGTINQTLQTLHVAATYGGGMPVAGVVLNDVEPVRVASDASAASNPDELRRRCRVPLLAHVAWGAVALAPTAAWDALWSTRRTEFIPFDCGIRRTE